MEPTVMYNLAPTWDLLVASVDVRIAAFCATVGTAENRSESNSSFEPVLSTC